MKTYFTVEVKPTIPASKQAVFADGKVLFDWTSFKIPRGAAKLVSVCAVLRGENGSPQAPNGNRPKIDLFFAKAIDRVAPATIGSVNTTMVAKPQVSNHIIGMTHLDASDFGQNAGDFWTVGQTSGGATGNMMPNVILQGEAADGDVAFDTIYLAGAAGNAIDFGTTVIARGGEAAGVTVVETDKGANDDPEAEFIFAPGDVLHSATDDVLGTVASISSFGSNKQDINFTAGTTDVIADDEEIFNINPIRFILMFER